MRYLFHNIGLKALSIVIASALSAYVFNEVNYPIPETLYLPLVIRNLRNDLVLLEAPPKTISIRVRGPYRYIRRFQSTRLNAVADCRDVTSPGQYTLPLALPDLGDLTITSQQMEALEIVVDNRVDIEQPVAIDRRGQFAENFKIGTEELSSATVHISGPKTVVEQVVVAQIEPDLSRMSRRLSGQAEKITQKFNVRLYDDTGQPLLASSLRITPDAVEYSVLPEPLGSIKVLKVIPDYNGEPPENYLMTALNPNPLYVPVEARLVPKGVFALRTTKIDVNGRKESFTEEAGILYPFEVPEESSLPRSCAVSVDIVSLADQGISAVRIEVQLLGRNGKLDYVVTPLQLQVLSEDLESISPEDQTQIHATVDVTGLKPGEYRFSPQLVLPLRLERARIIPQTVTLSIIEAR